MLESKDYYIDLINSSKANKMVSYYHYSGVGFKKAKINQGIYRKSDNLLVGVLQWGCSAQENIRLDRYIKEQIPKEHYLELNRFCMADSEGKNAESQAIALGIKWIKQNMPEIELLVSYAGRKEGNYGYIYQATNWEYLGYFISDGFWLLDGQERHQITVWYHYNKYADQSLSFKEGLSQLYHDVRKTWTKQFIYIQRLNKNLHCATAPLTYPKPSTDFPICTRIEIIKEDNEFLTQCTQKERIKVEYYYEKEEQLFTLAALKRQGKVDAIPHGVAIYTRNGELYATYTSIKDALSNSDFTESGLRDAAKSEKIYKGYFIRKFVNGTMPPESIDVPFLCVIDGIKFMKQVEVANYCEVTRQAVSYAKKNGQTIINGKSIEWNF